MVMEVIRYEDKQADEWDAFVREGKISSFLFYRGYMDYHRKKFPDHSYLIYDDKERLTALMPGTVEGGTYHSHAGLTYGGMISGLRMTTPLMLAAFDALLTRMKADGIRELTYKSIPHIYHKVPADEDRYVLYLAGATLTRRDVFSVIGQPRIVPFQQRRKRGAKKALKSNVHVEVSQDLAAYWQILIDTLMSTHGTKPVHTLDEITLLASRFPHNIKLMAAFHDNAMIAGVLIYESDRVARAQYIAANTEGRRLGALDAIFDVLINETYCDKPWLDLGPSNEAQGTVLNRGLIEQKEGFGARAVAHDFYSIDVSHYKKGSLLQALR